MSVQKVFSKIKTNKNLKLEREVALTNHKSGLGATSRTVFVMKFWVIIAILAHFSSFYSVVL